ncbi:RDD family protein [Mucilaginibacter psychrotolerans]|uniref:RDD family protein n=1 Tax=Mucilaginibacter psychrotolerans TaxID=1524096 RepID=A0A4Y8SH89_9SPHI|nr:RDD family protein [Mucilaginibacter psychrotolerans]TFF37995.1 RDD family protein [Mucilaginibacter psychrotolerans]
MNDTYYIQDNGQQTGPYTLKELLALDLDVDTMVLTPGNEEWQEASYIPELFEYFEDRGIYFPTEGNLANFWIRLLAYFLDLFIISIVLSLVAQDYVLELSKSFNIENPNQEQAIERLKFSMALYVLLALYNTLCESTPMRGSIGKKLCRLAVVDADGRRLGVGRALLRNFFKILSSLPLNIGFLPILWTERRQAWHDMIAKTYVIRRDV